jgi:hypothetical protein
VKIKQMTARELRKFLVENDACSKAMQWYDLQKKRDLRSIVASVSKPDWFYWLIDRIRLTSKAYDAAYARDFPASCNRYGCLTCFCYSAGGDIEAARKKIKVI